MKRLVLHIGFHRTGTTSTQYFFNSNRLILSEYCAVYTAAPPNNLARAASKWTRRYSRQPNPECIEKFETSFGAFIDLVRTIPQAVAIASDEDFLGHVPLRGTRNDYAEMMPMVAVMGRVLRRNADWLDARIHLSYRDEGRWLRSLYSHHLRGKRLRHDFREFCDALAPAINFATLIESYRLALDGVALSASRLEDNQDMDFGPATPLLKLAEIPIDLVGRLAMTEPQRRGPSDRALRMILRINRNRWISDARAAAIKKTVVRMSRRGYV